MDNIFQDKMVFSPEIEKAIIDLGYTEATPIQQMTIPIIMSGKDITGQAQTGTGKTCAFAIPAIEAVNPELRKEQVLVLCPTRELALQCSSEFKKLLKYKRGVKVLALYGGQNIDYQIRDLKSRPAIIVGTPGRILDHLKRRTIRLNNLKMIILDEADEMLNMGFIDDIELILSKAPDERQTILFSATMPKQILDISKQYQKEPEYIKIESDSLTVENIKQYCCEVSPNNKLIVLKELLNKHRNDKSLIFCNTKKQVDLLVTVLTRDGFNVKGLHGDMKQTVRTEVMNLYKKNKVSVLIATDVAARGIDVKGIKAVFNYDIPRDREFYVHRIGRTARAGETGIAYTLAAGRSELIEMKSISRFTNSEIEYLKFTEDKPTEVKQSQPPKAFSVYSSTKRRRGGRRR